MTKFVFDANVPIGLSERKIEFLDKAMNIMLDNGHEIIMSKQNCLLEVAYNVNLYKCLKGYLNFKEIDVPEDKYLEVRADCRGNGFFRLDRRDYNVICAALIEDADIIVTNDRKLRLITTKYKEKKGITDEKLIITHIPGLIHYLYKDTKEQDLCLLESIEVTLNYYNYHEISRIPKLITKFRWDEARLQEMFHPYKTGVCNCAGGESS